MACAFFSWAAVAGAAGQAGDAIDGSYIVAAAVSSWASAGRTALG